MRSSRVSTWKNNVNQKSGLKVVSVLKSSLRESTSPLVNQVVTNTSWNEDFVLKLSDESDKSITPESNRRQKVVRFNESTISEKWRESEERISPTIIRESRTAPSVRVEKSNSPKSILDKCMTAMVVLEKLTELSLSHWIKPRKGFNIRRKINSDDELSMRIKRYCMKCTKIVINASSKDDELCCMCNTVLLFHCIKCGKKLMTNLGIRRHLESNCNSPRKSRLQAAELYSQKLRI